MTERRWRFVIETSDMPDDLAAVWLSGFMDAAADWPGAEVTADEHYAYYELEGGERLFRVHPVDACRGEHCTIHNPSDHHMRGWPQHWRQDRGLMERICLHGVGHPDPDDINPDTVHGCDGCCADPKENTDG